MVTRVKVNFQAIILLMYGSIWIRYVTSQEYAIGEVNYLLALQHDGRICFGGDFCAWPPRFQHFPINMFQLSFR
ncbi:hypothetical protein GCK32_021689, partial [Trichostrongylus colubriformis]